MSARAAAFDQALETRARQSLGASSAAIYRMIERVLDERGIRGGTLIDVGCGSGQLWRVLGHRFSRYVGLDAVRYQGFPSDGELYSVDLDTGSWPIPGIPASVVAAVETIEHLENPWAFMRRLAALAAPGAWVIVTTPNQLSALSLLTVVVKSRFSAFQDSHYPAHKTALLESDLQRAAREAGLERIAVAYSHSGRLPLSGRHYPAALAGRFPRLLSDNVMVIAQKGRAS
jgi:2-polyprenyl-3-methyl-5-hydroxy-6-metoxy-1,4-benzoquinol methylase